MPETPQDERVRARRLWRKFEKEMKNLGRFSAYDIAHDLNARDRARLAGPVQGLPRIIAYLRVMQEALEPGKKGDM